MEAGKRDRTWFEFEAELKVKGFAETSDIWKNEEGKQFGALMYVIVTRGKKIYSIFTG